MKQETIIHIVHMEGKPHGGEIYAMNCAIGQKTMGHNVIFIYSISSHDFYYRELESYGIKTFGMQLRKEFRKSISTIRTLINEECVTIIHSHNFIPNIIGTIAKFGIPETLHIITIHGVLKHYWNPGFSRIRMYWILFVVYRMADLVISVSDAAKNDMMSYFHLSAQKIFTLKNAISVQRIMKNSSYTISKDSIGISA